MAQLKKRDLSPDEKSQLFDDLRKQLEDWGTSLFHRTSFQAWLHYDTYGVYPYPGSFMDQPTYIQDDFTLWTMLKRWHELNEESRSPDGLPTMKNLVM